MVNTVSITKNGIILEIFEGDQSYDTVQQTTDKLSEKIEEVKKKGKEAKVLIDLTGIGSTNAGSRKASVGALRNLDYDKIALFGGSNYVRHLSNFVIKASGRSKKAKVFKEKKEAMKWLEKKGY